MTNYALFNPASVERLKQTYANNSTAKAFIDSVITFAYTSRLAAPRPIAVMDIEGNLNSTDEVVVNDDMDILVASGVRFRFTGDRISLFVAQRFLMGWAGTYLPIGNPITEEVFYKFVFGYDLVKDYMPTHQKKKIDAFLSRLFVTASVFTAARIPALSHSNFESRGLMLMTAIAYALGHGQMQKYALDLFTSQINLNLLAAGTIQTSIPYIANAPEMAAHANDPVEKGMTFDFIHRDAVEYHVASIGGLLFAALVAKNQGLDWYGIVSARGVTLNDGVAFAKLYGDGTRTHMDFVGSFVGFDHEQNREALFDPVHAQGLVCQAAMVAPRYIGLYSPTLLPLSQQVLYYAMT